MIKMHELVLVMMWVFLGIGGFLFLFTLTIYACNEGTCGCYECFRCCCLCLSCGCCDFGKKNRPA